MSKAVISRKRSIFLISEGLSQLMKSTGELYKLHWLWPEGMQLVVHVVERGFQDDSSDGGGSSGLHIELRHRVGTNRASQWVSPNNNLIHDDY